MFRNNLQKRLQQLESGHIVKPSSSYNTPPMPVNKMGASEKKDEESKLVNQVSSTEDKQKDVQVPASTEPQKNFSKGVNNEMKAIWQSFLDNISSFASRAILKQHALPVKFTPEEVIIAIKTESWLTKFRDESERLILIEAAAKIVTGGEPKIVLRAPQAGDDTVCNNCYKDNNIGRNSSHTRRRRPSRHSSKQRREQRE